MRAKRRLLNATLLWRGRSVSDIKNGCVGSRSRFQAATETSPLELRAFITHLGNAILGCANAHGDSVGTVHRPYLPPMRREASREAEGNFVEHSEPCRTFGPTPNCRSLSSVEALSCTVVVNGPARAFGWGAIVAGPAARRKGNQARTDQTGRARRGSDERHPASLESLHFAETSLFTKPCPC
jgi:hypothetical protein